MFSKKPATVNDVCDRATKELEDIMKEQMQVSAAAADAQDKLDREYEAKSDWNRSRINVAEKEAGRASKAIDNFRALFGVKDEASDLDGSSSTDS